MRRACLRLLAVLVLTNVVSAKLWPSGPTLLVQYSFDELGGDAIDLGLAPTANGTLLGQATRTLDTPAGFSRSALDLTGISTDFVSAGDPAKLDALSSFSATFWLNLRDTYLGTGRILGKHDLASTGFDLVAAPSNASGFTTMDANEFSLQLMHESSAATSTADIDAQNKWVFVGMTYDGSVAADNLRFYLGDESANVSQLGATLDHAGGTATANTIDFTIGGAGPVFADLTLPGRFDDVRIYGGVLPQSSLELIRLSNISNAPDGDFNDDLRFDCQDADLLTMQIASGGGDLGLLFDMTGDGTLNLDDLDAWLAVAGAANLGAGQSYQYGDANLDGVVDGQDFLVWNAHKFSTNPRWCSGNFNGDSLIDGGDFLLWNQNKFSGSTLPEPRMSVAWVVWLLCCLKWRPNRMDKLDASDPSS